MLKYFDTRERQQYQNKLCNVYYVPATAAIMRMKAIEQVGLFDTDYFFGMEAADWCVRAREADWLTAILPNLTVTHHVERTGDVRNTLHAYYSVRNRFLFIRKRCKTNKAAWTLRWVWRTSLAATDALRRAQPMRARALWAALSDGLHNRGGPAPVWIR